MKYREDSAFFLSFLFLMPRAPLEPPSPGLIREYFSSLWCAGSSLLIRGNDCHKAKSEFRRVPTGYPCQRPRKISLPSTGENRVCVLYIQSYTYVCVCVRACMYTCIYIYLLVRSWDFSLRGTAPSGKPFPLPNLILNSSRLISRIAPSSPSAIKWNSRLSFLLTFWLFFSLSAFECDKNVQFNLIYFY